MKREQDSIYIVKMKEGYIWVNTDTVWVKGKPDPKAETLGRLYRLSYVKGYEVENKPEWVEISFGPHSGFVKKQDLADRWQDMSLTEDELNDLKVGRYYSFNATGTYKIKLDNEAAAEERALKAANAVPARKYIRGPKNGCYYINSSGNKEYVDHSFCN